MGIARTILFYSALTLVIRLLGKRQVGQMEPSEFVVTMLIANLASIPLENPEIPVWGGLIPMGVVLVLERFISWLCLRSIRARRLLCGKPVVLIENGRLLRENLRKTRVNLDERSCHLRDKGVLEIEKGQFAILETNGALTVFPFPQHQPATAADAGIRVARQEIPYTIISDGHLIRQNLILAGKDEQWLSGFLSGKGCSKENVLLLTLTEGGVTALIRRDGTA